jgi:hypothetical protein
MYPWEGINMDYYFSYISLSTNTRNPYYLRGATEIKDFLLSIKEGDVFKIAGLGTLKVSTIERHTYPDNMDKDTTYHEIGLICNRVWRTEADSLYDSTPAEIPNTDDAWVDHALAQMVGEGGAGI